MHRAPGPLRAEDRTRLNADSGPVHAFEATPVVGESAQAAYLDAEARLVRRHERKRRSGNGPRQTPLTSITPREYQRRHDGQIGNAHDLTGTSAR